MSMYNMFFLFIFIGFALASYLMVSINMQYYIMINNSLHDYCSNHESFKHSILLINTSFWMLLYYCNLYICVKLINVDFINTFSTKQIISFACIIFHYIYGITAIVCYYSKRDMLLYCSHDTAFIDGIVIYLLSMSVVLFLCSYIRT